MAMTEYGVSLVIAAKNGDSSAYEKLYGLYYNKVFALARATVRNEADAEDILQEAFVNAWRYLGSLEDPAAWCKWIQKITLNLCHSLLRKKNIAILLDAESDMDDFGDIESDELLPAVYAERDDLRVRLGKIIDGLSDVQKQTIILYYFNELKVEEIAYVMECSTGTVKTRLFLSRRAIRAEVEEQERISGQKFYGVAGIAMLGLGQLLAQQLGTKALSPAASQGILQSISQTITKGAIGASQYAQTAAVAAHCAKSSVTATASGAAAKAGTSLATKIIAGVVAATIVAGGGVAAWITTRDNPEPSPIVTDRPTDEGRPTDDNQVVNYYGNTPGNIINGGIAAIQGNRIYYTAGGMSSGFSLNAMNADGSGRQKLYDDFGQFGFGQIINVVGDSIYYVINQVADGPASSVEEYDGDSAAAASPSAAGDAPDQSGSGWPQQRASYIYTIKTDGSDRQMLAEIYGEGFYYIDYMYVIGGRIYFSTHEVGGGKLYVMNTDGGNKQAINDEFYRIIRIEGDDVYYTVFDFEDFYGLFVMNTDGGNKQMLCELSEYGIHPFRGSAHILIDQGRIYTSNIDGIFSMNVDGSDLRKLSDDRAEESINIANGRIYYSIIRDTVGLYVINTDGGGRLKLCDDDVSAINIAGDHIFYYERNLHSVFSIRTDGSDRRILNEGPMPEPRIPQDSGDSTTYGGSVPESEPPPLNVDIGSANEFFLPDGTTFDMIGFLLSLENIKLVYGTPDGFTFTNTITYYEREAHARAGYWSVNIMGNNRGNYDLGAFYEVAYTSIDALGGQSNHYITAISTGLAPIDASQRAVAAGDFYEIAYEMNTIWDENENARPVIISGSKRMRLTRDELYATIVMLQRINAAPHLAFDPLSGFEHNIVFTMPFVEKDAGLSGYGVANEGMVGEEFFFYGVIDTDEIIRKIEVRPYQTISLSDIFN